MTLSVEVEATSGAARATTITTARGTVRTPAFMPVGTRGAVRAVDTGDLEALGAQIVLGNTYHLLFRPGSRDRRADGRDPRVHRLARPRAHRQRRLPGLLAVARRSTTTG